MAFAVKKENITLLSLINWLFRSIFIVQTMIYYIREAFKHIPVAIQA